MNTKTTEVIELTPEQALKRLQDLEAEETERKQERERLLSTLRAQDLAKAIEIIRRHGFSARELGLVPVVTATVPAPAATKTREARYMNPEAPYQTWGGGGNPKWVLDAKAKGLTLDDLAIEKVKAKLIAEGKMNEDGSIKQ